MRTCILSLLLAFAAVGSGFARPLDKVAVTFNEIKGRSQVIAITYKWTDPERLCGAVLIWRLPARLADMPDGSWMPDLSPDGMMKGRQSHYAARENEIVIYDYENDQFESFGYLKAKDSDLERRKYIIGFMQGMMANTSPQA